MKMQNHLSAPVRLSDFIDLKRYPLDDLNSPRGQELVAQCHSMMEKDTLCVLPGFLKSSALFSLNQEIANLEDAAHFIKYRSTLYGWMDNSGFPEDHPRSQLPWRVCRTVTTDQLNRRGPCASLYALDELTEFIRQLLGFDQLYRMVCPTLSIQVNIMNKGEEFGWHFDTNDGVVSFTLQNADSGGGFEYAPLIRDEENENYEGVKQLLGGSLQPKQPHHEPGTFTLFLGRRSLHRVAPVGESNQSRRSLLFSYDREPNRAFPEKTCRRLMGLESGPYLGALTPPPDTA